MRGCLIAAQWLTNTHSQLSADIPSYMKSVLPISVLWALVFLAQLPMTAVYGLRLMANPIYGWWPCLIPLAVLAFVWWRWDYKLEFPRHLLAILGLALGLTAALLSAYFLSDWLACLGLVCTTGSFLVSHHQRDGQSLLSIWFLSWSLLRIPGNGTSQITQLLAGLLDESTRSILRFAQIPHVDYSTAIEVPGARFYLDQNVYSMLSWPLFVAVAMFYSTLMRRTCIEAVLNLFLALFWCFAFHCALTASFVMIPLVQNSWQAWCAASFWGFASFALFLSSERGLRVVLQPISESTSDARLVNPFVLAWNWCLSERTKGASKWRIGEKWFQRPAMWVVVVAVGLTLLLQLIQSPRALAAWAAVNPIRIDTHTLAEFMFSKGEDFDYRRTRHSPPLVLDREVDVWTYYAPLMTTEHIFDVHERRVFDLSSLIPTLGWQMEKIEYVPIKLLSGEPLTYGSLNMHNGKQRAHVLFAWLSRTGRPLDPSNQSESGYLLMSKVELVTAHQFIAKKQARGAFSFFVHGVRNQLTKSSSP